MESLLAELERKRKQLDLNTVTSKQKYFKRGELAKQQADDYHKKNRVYLEEKGLLNDEEPSDETGSTLIRNISKSKTDNLDHRYQNIDKSELARRFREKGEPIRLFGEVHEDRCQRLRLIEMMSRDEDKGLRNDFKAAMDRVAQSYMEKVGADGSGEHSQMVHDVKLFDKVYSLDELNQMTEQLSDGDMQASSKIVLEFLRHLCQLWGEDLNKRELHEKISVSGKLKSAQFEQTMAYLKPLYRKLRSVSLTADILNALTGIVKFLLAREYVKANDMYLQMAIGNAPWPIGVTNPGIHARTGREKISTSLVAHVLNDETQRKYIQALKRLMTYAQKKYMAAPSKCVEYQGVN